MDVEIVGAMYIGGSQATVSQAPHDMVMVAITGDDVSASFLLTRDEALKFSRLLIDGATPIGEEAV